MSSCCEDARQNSRRNLFAGKQLRCLTVTSVPGIADGTPYQIKGDSENGVFRFDGKGKLTVKDGKAVIEVSRGDTLKPPFAKYEGSIKWTLILNPGEAAEKSMGVGTTGSHVLFTTYGTPKEGDDAAFHVTTRRMESATIYGHQAYEKAQINTPVRKKITPQRIVYELVQLHKFNLKAGVVSPGDAKTIVKGWSVPGTWRFPLAGQTDVGSDCLSGATWVNLVVSQMGLPGKVEAINFVPELTKDGQAVKINPTKAVKGDLNTDPLATRTKNNVAQRLYLFDGKNEANAYEGTVVYTPEADKNTFYFPAGTTRKFGSANDVLTVFVELAWAEGDRETRKWKAVEQVHKYTPAKDISVDE